MKTDLRNLVTAQEGFYFDNNDYAGSTTAGAQVNALGGAGQVTFLPSTGNVLTLTYISNTGYTAVMTNPVLAAGLAERAGSSSVPAANAPNAAVTQEGAPPAGSVGSQTSGQGRGRAETCPRCSLRDAAVRLRLSSPPLCSRSPPSRRSPWEPNWVSRPAPSSSPSTAGSSRTSSTGSS